MKSGVCPLILALALVFFPQLGLADQAQPKECHRKTIDRLQDKIKADFGYRSFCILSNTGFEGCLEGLETLALALRAPETRNREFDSVALSDHFTGTDRTGSWVTIKVGSSLKEIQQHLASQRDRSSPEVVKEQKIQAEITQLRKTVTSQSGLEVYCMDYAIGLSTCVEALKKLIVALKDPETHRRDFKTIYLHDHFENTDVGQVVQVDGRLTAIAIQNYLLRQRSSSSNEVKAERKTREEIARLETDSKKISGCNILCVIPINGLNESLEGMQKLNAAFTKIGKKAEGISVYLTNRNKCLSIDGDLHLDHRLSALEMEHEILRAVGR